MEAEKKESNGLTIFLVILSALGMLAIIIALAFAFFYPGNASSIFSSGPPKLSSAGGTAENPEPVRESIDISGETLLENETEPTTETPDSTDNETISEDPINTQMEVTLDDSDALIDSLMSDDEFETDGTLSIQFEREEKEEVIPVTQEEPEVTVPVNNRVENTEPRYRTVEKEVYWLQVGSFPNSIKAEELKEQLNTYGIHSNIQTRDISGTLYYRVRIGAFKTRGEAESFDSQIKDLPEISDTRIYTATITEKEAY